MAFERGSEWRKWDLHIHTPSSYDYKNKNITNEQIIDKLVAQGISVVAITDHHFIDVSRIKELQKLGEGKITVLPGIELKADARGSDPVHFIGIFKEDCNLIYIWDELRVHTRLNTLIAECYDSTTYYVDFDETIHLIHRLGGIVTVHAGNKTNTIENITNSLPEAMAQKTELANIIDIYELGKESDQDGYKKKVFPTIKKVIPMIICTDNHDITNYKVKQNCWIKADPTFEGLKQITYEPDRVKIQELIPQEKTQYQVIDTIIINSENIYNTEIKLNSDLNCIIGGRSTGKSMLLGALANKLNQYPKDKIEKNPHIKQLSEDLTIQWLDNSSEQIREIEYIHQGAMYDLHNTTDNSNSKLKKMITEILLLKIDKKNKYNTYTEKCLELNKKISSSILDILATKTTLTNQKSTISQLGNEEMIKNEIDRLQKAISKIQVISDDEQQELKEFSNKLSNLKLQILQDDLTEKLAGIKDVVLNMLPTIDLIQFPDLKNIYESTCADFKQKMTVQLDIEDQKIKSKLQNLKEKEKEIEDDIRYQNLIKKTDASSEYSKLNKQLLVQNQSIQKLIEEEEELNSLNEKFNRDKASLLEDLKKYFIYTNEVCKYLTITKSELNIKSKPRLLKDKIKKSFSETLKDTRNLDENKFLDCFLQSENEQQFPDCLSKILEDLLGDSSIIKSYRSGKSSKDLINNMIDNLYEIEYILTYENDEYRQMSEGKKSFVVLKLILEFSNKQCPLLIDQPEDDLDNRSIYDDLVSYIRDKKQHRQIILATHNPNIVVGADAEEVIIANQHGTTTKNKDDKKFQYLTGSLENTQRKDVNNTIILDSQGIREHVCEILEGGEQAFQKRKKRYQLK